MCCWRRIDVCCEMLICLGRWSVWPTSHFLIGGLAVARAAQVDVPEYGGSPLDRSCHMGAIKKLSSVLAHPTAYRVWQSPFAAAKFEPILRHNNLSRVQRVLDVGCGPGTNARLFEGRDYLGLDLNEDYVQQARQRTGMQFEVADVCSYQADEASKFDFVLMNSLLHHIDDESTRRILKQLTHQLTPDGNIHILDLVLPANRCLSRSLALADRGDYPRPLEKWYELFTEHFDKVLFEPYPLKMCGLTMWSMVYFKGRPRQN